MIDVRHRGSVTIEHNVDIKYVCGGEGRVYIMCMKDESMFRRGGGRGKERKGREGGRDRRER